MANNFAADSNCVAVWNLESGALGVDSKGGNTLTNTGVVANSSLYKQGAASGDFELSESDYMSITDAALDAGFPLKLGDSNKQISACGWFLPESLPPATTYIAAKYSTSDNKRSVAFTVSSTGQFRLAIGHTNGTAFESATMDTLTMVAGNWYHWAFTYDDATRAYRIRCRRDGQPAVELAGNFTNQVSVTDSPFTLGAYGSGLGFSDGLIDEVVVFKDILSATEIDQIYAGTYTLAFALTVADAAHAHSVDALALTFHEGGFVLVVADALHAHSVDALQLMFHSQAVQITGPWSPLRMAGRAPSMQITAGMATNKIFAGKALIKMTRYRS